MSVVSPTLDTTLKRAALRPPFDTFNPSESRQRYCAKAGQVRDTADEASDGSLCLFSEVLMDVSGALFTGLDKSLMRDSDDGSLCCP